MRKQLIAQPAQKEIATGENWLDLEAITQVELTSEQEAFPIEGALTLRAGPGWRAQTAGPQTIRLHFEKPLSVSCIQLVFEELKQARTQEFVLSWLGQDGKPYKEIVRQQYTFSPAGTTREVEEYQVELPAVKGLALTIIPDISRSDAYASLLALRLR